MGFKEAAAACALLGAGAAWAGEPVEIGQVARGLVYYNRPGATVKQHNTELAECSVIAAKSHTKMRYTVVGQSGVPYDMTWLHDLIWGASIAGLDAVRVENCMLVRGWRVVRPLEQEGEGLAALSIPELASRLEPLIGAASPPGEVARSFGNEALHPGSYRTATYPLPPAKQQLSLKLFAAQGDVKPPEPWPLTEPTIDRRWPAQSLKTSELDKAPPGSALIVARVTGISNAHGVGVGFMRMGEGPDDRPGFRDHMPDTAHATTGFLFAKKDGNWFIRAVPPGRWRISASNVLNYCLGSPFFEVNAGEVVYAGTFHLEGPNLGPDLDLEPVRTYLGQAGPNVRAAVYRNGSRGRCYESQVAYALEFPGAPFEPDYLWGTAAKGR